MNKSFFYNFEHYMDDISKIVYSIEKSGVKYELVVGVERGGVVPAIHLSYMLDVPYSSLLWSNKKGRVRDTSNSKIKIALEKNQKVLVVDDICDNGTTIKEIVNVYSGVDTATLIYNNINDCQIIPTYYGWEIDREKMPEWIDFWWEKK